MEGEAASPSPLGEGGGAGARFCDSLLCIPGVLARQAHGVVGTEVGLEVVEVESQPLLQQTA